MSETPKFSSLPEFPWVPGMPDNENFRQMLQAMNRKEIRQCFDEISRIAAFEVSAEFRKPFLRFHNYITNPQPVFITNWRDDPTQEKWYHRLVNGILGDVQSAFSATVYHLSRLTEIEEEVSTFLDGHNFRQFIGQSTIGLGDTKKLDFEYQAYVLSYRRCLDYLARSLAGYFKRDCTSFRQFPKNLRTAPAASVANALLKVHGNHVQTFQFVLNEGEGRSVRDRIAHYEFVSAGCINLRADGFKLVGGGENRGMGNTSAEEPLGSALLNRTNALIRFLGEIVDAFIDSAAALDGHSS